MYFYSTYEAKDSDPVELILNLFRFRLEEKSEVFVYTQEIVLDKRQALIVLGVVR